MQANNFSPVSKGPSALSGKARDSENAEGLPARLSTVAGCKSGEPDVEAECPLDSISAKKLPVSTGDTHEASSFPVGSVNVEISGNEILKPLTLDLLELTGDEVLEVSGEERLDSLCKMCGSCSSSGCKSGELVVKAKCPLDSISAEKLSLSLDLLELTGDEVLAGEEPLDLLCKTCGSCSSTSHSNLSRVAMSDTTSCASGLRLRALLSQGLLLRGLLLRLRS